MLASVASSSLEGVSGRLINVECNLSNNLPNIVIVGLGSKSVDESKERIRSAFSNSKLGMPRKRITLNLAPADIAKSGVGFDLPMALSILLRSEQIPRGCLHQSSAVGELGLDGSIRPVRGIIGHVLAAKQSGVESIYVPKNNLKQASLVTGIRVYGVDTLKNLYRHLTDMAQIQSVKTRAIKGGELSDNINLDDIRNQQLAKRALIIAAAGGHNLLLSGPPGTGKTMLAKAYPSLLPNLDNNQVLEVTQLHSLASRSNQVITTPPLRQPHHTASHIAVLGGGRPPLPGEVTLAHRGVLFLDELPEFSRQTLEGLRQPIEDSYITIARAEQTVTYPADFALIATQNPCPCGYYGDSKKQCSCLPTQRLNYEKKLSGPLRDRFDMTINVPRVEASSIINSGDHTNKQTKNAKKQVGEARDMQHERHQYSLLNSQLNNRQVHKFSQITPEAKELLTKASDKLLLSPRSIVRCLRVSRTIADLDKSKQLKPHHIAEALRYRHETSSG